MRECTRRDRHVAARLRRVYIRRMAYLRVLFGQFCVDGDDVEARSMLAFTLFVGNLLIVAQHDGRSRSKVLHLAFDLLLREPQP